MNLPKLIHVSMIFLKNWLVTILLALLPAIVLLLDLVKTLKEMSDNALTFCYMLQISQIGFSVK